MSKNNKKWRNVGLYVILAVVVVALGTAFLDRPTNNQLTWKYSEFIDEVQTSNVERVTVSADRSQAIATSRDGQRYIVNLPDDRELIDILSENKVDISVIPQNDDSFWLRALSSLFFPVLLLVGLFFLLRRASNGPGSQAMNFGKSKARVQMEPQTQVTFSDVAGIEQAKLELTEVVDFLKNGEERNTSFTSNCFSK